MNSDADKKPRPRSPEFPFIPLNEAIPKVEQLIGANQRHAARIKTLAPLWGYSPASSSFLRIVAALRAFGLIEDTGSGDDRKIAVSDLGVRIASDKRPGARETAIQKAFDSCGILNDYHQKWDGQRPSDSACISELTLDNGFTPTAARKFISVYDDSVAFVEANRGDGSAESGMTPTADGPLPDPKAAEGSREEESRRKLPMFTKARVSDMTEATYPIAEGICTLMFPKNMSPKSAQRLNKWLNLMLEDVQELAQAKQPDDEPKAAEE